MLLPKNKKVPDPGYLQTFKGTACEACGLNDGTTVPAHVRAGHEGGLGLKPPDHLVVGLCFDCHAEQERNPGGQWWFDRVFKRWLKLRYEEWKRDNR